MNKLVLATAAAITMAGSAAHAQTPPPAATVGTLPVLKNWTAPNYKMHAQALVDETVAKHPELLSLTLQGTPPGHKGIYTMFAGTFPERIGKASSADDILVVDKGYTIIDPRWRKVDDPKKFTLLMPLRDQGGETIGLAVVVYRLPSTVARTEQEFFARASALRDDLARRIPNAAALFQPAR